MAFRLLIAMDVIEVAESLHETERDEMRKAFRRIKDDPNGSSDATDYDSEGRMVNIHIVGDYALVYWIDHADRHTKILDIHAADQ